MAKKLDTVKELLFWSYANLAMAHSAVTKKQKKYMTYNYMIRAKLYKGLINGTMNLGSIFDDEKVKLSSGQKCSYCGFTENLAVDHLLPKKRGGKDEGDNLIYACKSCNSSKGKKDLMEWMDYKKTFPPLMVLRRYLKLVIAYCTKNDLMGCCIEEIIDKNLPFKLGYVPVKFPKPCELVLSVEKIMK